MSESVVVPDTSVVVKWFLQDESLADQALLLRHSYLVGEITLVVPALLAYELANVLHFKANLTTEQVQLAIQSLFDMDVVWVSPEGTLLQQAVDLARAYKLTVHDAAFVALAEQEGALFVTADGRLAQQLSRFPFVRLLGDA